MSEDELVGAENIDDMPSDRLTPIEEQEAERLYRELCEDIARGDPWGLGDDFGLRPGPSSEWEWPLFDHFSC